MNRLPILMFHAINPMRTPVAVDRRTFARSLQRLAARGWRTISGADALAFARGDGKPRPKSFVVTFDDAYASVFAEAAPVLRELGFGAILFLTTGLMEKSEIFPGDPLCPREASMTWNDARTLAKAGFEIGSHACAHRDLRRVSDAELAQEMAGSRKELEDRVGVPVRLHAYPFGFHDARVATAARRVYDGAVTTDLDFVRPGASLFALPRLDAHYLRFLASRGDLDGPGTRAYLSIRRAGRAVRARLHRGDEAS